MPISGQLIFPENSTYADFEVSLVDDNIPELEVVYQVSIYIQWCSRNSKKHFAQNLLVNRTCY